MGLAAIVQSVTYTVPAWLPPLLVSLAPYEDDAHSSVKDAVSQPLPHNRAVCVTYRTRSPHTLTAHVQHR